MSGVLDAVRDVVCAVLLLTGAVLCLLAAVGLLRFPDTLGRLHAAAKGQSLGLLLILFGTAVRLPPRYATVLVLVVVFQMVTAPIAGQVVGRTGESAADLLGLSSEVGSLEPGKQADLIAVSGDPLADVRVLKSVRFVMRGGRVYKG